MAIAHGLYNGVNRRSDMVPRYYALAYMAYDRSQAARPGSIVVLISPRNSRAWHAAGWGRMSASKSAPTQFHPVHTSEQTWGYRVSASAPLPRLARHGKPTPWPAGGTRTQMHSGPPPQSLSDLQMKPIEQVSRRASKELGIPMTLSTLATMRPRASPARARLKLMSCMS
ncbi:hypothetical protein C8T65DRAFT_673266 [Cerioporus squamosus]|nr:hypothetical protein C8T65DRAFT_673266 [Cerioporus squamosus]